MEECAARLPKMMIWKDEATAEEIAARYHPTAPSD